MSLDRPGAQHVWSRLMRESLVDKNLLARTELQVSAIPADANAVFNGIPPYSLWEHPPSVGKLPPHGGHDLPEGR